MRKFSAFLYEQVIKENDEKLSPEFEEALKKAQAAFDNGDYDEAFAAINSVEPTSSEEESIKQHFVSMLSDKQGDFSSRFAGP